jgi:hypothetical protein
MEAEGVHFLSPGFWAHKADHESPNMRTTFYAQTDLEEGKYEPIGNTATALEAHPSTYKYPASEFNANDEAEKVHFLSPGLHMHEADYNYPNMRTTFYGQMGSVAYDGSIQKKLSELI